MCNWYSYHSINIMMNETKNLFFHVSLPLKVMDRQKDGQKHSHSKDTYMHTASQDSKISKICKQKIRRHTPTHTCMHRHIRHTHIIYREKHAHTHTRTHAHTHTHTHTHTQHTYSLKGSLHGQWSLHTLAVAVALSSGEMLLSASTVE